MAPVMIMWLGVRSSVQLLPGTQLATSSPASEGSAVLATVRAIHVPTAVYSSFNMCLLITTCLHFSPPWLVIGYSALPTPQKGVWAAQAWR